MPLNREEVRNIVAQIEGTSNLDFQLGVISAAYAATDDEVTKQQLTTSLVYLQTRAVNDTMAAVSELTRSIQNALEIPNSMISKAGEEVSNIIKAEREEARKHETESDEGRQD